MSEEMKSDSTQVNQENMVENKQETSSDYSLLHEVMQKKEKIKSLEAELAKRDADDEKRRQKQLAEDGKKDELIVELNQKVEHLTSEHTRLSKYEDDEKTNLIASIAADEAEAETLSKESLSTLRLLKNKIAAKPSEAPTARGSVGKQPPPTDWTTLSPKEGKERWADIIAAAQRKMKN